MTTGRYAADRDSSCVFPSPHASHQSNGKCHFHPLVSLPFIGPFPESIFLKTLLPAACVGSPWPGSFLLRYLISSRLVTLASLTGQLCPTPGPLHACVTWLPALHNPPSFLSDLKRIL